MINPANPYCDALHISPPALEGVKGHHEANTFALLLVALLERGGPMTLVEVAERFEKAGIAYAEDALLSLQRCRPARPPVYRDGDNYALDPHDDELDLWAFRLGLRPAKVPSLKVVQATEWRYVLVDDEDLNIDEWEVQAARLALPGLH